MQPDSNQPNNNNSSNTDDAIARALVAAQDLSTSIRDEYNSHIDDRIEARPQQHLRASSFGHACDRAIYLDIARWQDAKPFGRQAHRNFERGNVTESWVVGELNRMGFRVIGEQRSWYDESLNLSGRIEGHIVHSSEDILLEAKSAAGFWLSFLTSLDDAELGNYEYMLEQLRAHEYGQRYYAQTQIYLYLFNKLAAVLLLWDVGKWRPIPLPMPFNFEYAHNMIERAKRINVALAHERVPPHIDNARVCRNCRHFQHICDPPIATGDASIITDPDVIALLSEMEPLEGAAKRYTTLKNKFEKNVKPQKGEAPLPLGEKLLAVGPFSVTLKTTERKSYAVPDDVKQKYATKTPSTRITWERVLEREVTTNDDNEPKQ